jgi:murein DD-endopeptidase MepM/ murein hydrolase activator NlpD
MRFAYAALLLVAAAPASAASETRQGVDAEVSFVPTLAEVGSKKLLRYELRLTSFAKEQLTVRKLDILDRRSRRPLGSLSGDSLQRALRSVGGLKDGGATLSKGELSLLYVDLELPGDLVPAALTNVLRLSDGKFEFDVETAATGVKQAPPADLGPPLRGGPWVAVYEPGMDGGHRRTPYAVAGKATFPGRFAIDWFKVDKSGNHVSGAGAPVLAVADGIIVATNDDFEDPTPQAAPLGSDLRNDAGNYVAIDLGRGRVAFYEHLKHGLRVKTGQKVRRGQVIGFLGSTGHVTGPHLHFHMSDANSPLAAEGIPYGFRNLSLLGQYESIYAYERGGRWGSVPGKARGLPPPNSVIRFPAPASASYEDAHRPRR